MTTVTLIIGAAFIAVTLFVVLIGLVFRNSRANDRIAGNSEAELDALAAELSTEYIAPRRTGGPIDEAIYRLLAESGSRLTAGSAMLVVLCFVLLGGGIPFVLTENLLATAVGMFIGGIVPFLGWTFRRWRRQKAMRKRLPEALDIVADVVRAGRDLEQSAEMVAKDVTGPLGEEFGAAAAQLRLGQAAPAVLERMVERIPLPEFKIFATAVLVHRRAGGNLALLTERLARAARDRQEFAGHMGAVTAGSKLSAIGLVIGTIAAVVAVSLLQPTYYQKFFEHSWGYSLAALAGFLQLCGIVCVYRLLKVNF